MESIEQKEKSATEIVKSFKLTKNIPLDTRFIISNIDNLNTEIPVNKRYPGLKFFVIEKTGDESYDGEYYYFSNNLTTPKNLSESMESSDKYILLEGEETYADYLTKLNLLNKNIGDIVYLIDIEITVIKTGVDTWRYNSGHYYIFGLDNWDDLDDTLKQKAILCHNYEDEYEETYFVGNDFVLISIIENLDNLDSPEDAQEGRFYLVEQLIYLFANGDFYPIGNKFLHLTEQTLNIGDNIINHFFNSNYVFGYLRINIGSEYKTIPIEIINKNTSQCNIESDIYIESCNIILISNV